MKSKKARKIIENYLTYHPLPIWEANVYIHIGLTGKTKTYSWRRLLKIAYKLKDK